MCLYTCTVDDIEYVVLTPEQYSNNPLYGKLGMELITECPTKYLEPIIRTPFNLDKVSVRQGNRMTIIAALACMELDYRLHGVALTVISEPTQERIIETGIKLLKKDLPMRAKVVQSLLLAAFIELGLTL